MKFKEFAKWCNERACDGCWGMLEAMACIDISIFIPPYMVLATASTQHILTILYILSPLQKNL